MDQWRLPAWLAKAVARRLETLEAEGYGERLWEADASLWKPDDQEHQKIVANALGWLSVFEGVRDQLGELSEFVGELRGDGYRSAVLLGMGGSSLAPEVFQAVFGTRQGYLRLHVLDSTDPAAVLAVEAAVDLETTLFVVSSKSGGTTETASFHAYFYDRLKELDADHAGRHFIAITDEGTPLQQEALHQDFRAIFVNPSDIGGRYSALSYFGLVPAALIGVNLERLLDGVRDVAVACGPDVKAGDNPAVRLGAVLGEAALAGRDKLTIVTEPPLRALGAWIEQLVAESTGKEGKGIVPVDLEPLGDPSVYGSDRVFAMIGLDGVAASGLAQHLMDLARAGQPVVTHELTDEYGLGGELLRWEIAVATAGRILGIDPFDQPNVQESKDNTKRLIAGFVASGKLLEDLPEGRGRVAFPVRDDDLPAALADFLAEARPGVYVALQVYVTPSEVVWDHLQALRLQLRNGLRLATTVGYGPRFLHSTGQLHKGGPNTGLFLQLVGHDRHDVDIPGQPYSFSVLKRAQARGDLGALRAHGCRVLRVCLGDDVIVGVKHLEALIAAALRQSR